MKLPSNTEKNQRLTAKAIRFIASKELLHESKPIDDNFKEEVLEACKGKFLSKYEKPSTINKKEVNKQSLIKSSRSSS